MRTRTRLLAAFFLAGLSGPAIVPTLPALAQPGGAALQTNIGKVETALRQARANPGARGDLEGAIEGLVSDLRAGGGALPAIGEQVAALGEEIRTAHMAGTDPTGLYDRLESLVASIRSVAGLPATPGPAPGSAAPGIPPGGEQPPAGGPAPPPAQPPPETPPANGSGAPEAGNPAQPETPPAPSAGNGGPAQEPGSATPSTVADLAAAEAAVEEATAALDDANPGEEAQAHAALASALADLLAAAEAEIMAADADPATTAQANARRMAAYAALGAAAEREIEAARAAYVFMMASGQDLTQAGARLLDAFDSGVGAYERFFAAANAAGDAAAGELAGAGLGRALAAAQAGLPVPGTPAPGSGLGAPGREAPRSSAR